MKFDFLGIIFMIVAIAIGEYVGSFLTTYLGSLAVGVLGTLIVGVVVYLIYNLITRGKPSLLGALAFTVLVQLANMFSGYITGIIGVQGGIFALIFSGFFLSLLWGYIGGKRKR